MPSEDNKILQRALAPLLEHAGFRKDGATWRKSSASAIAVLNLQGSQWGRRFYLNLGIYLRELGDRERPCEYHCHLRLRASELVPDRARLEELLDFERRVAEEERLRELAALVEIWVVAWLQAMSDPAVMRAWLDAQRGIAVLIAPEARGLLGDERRA